LIRSRVVFGFGTKGSLYAEQALVLWLAGKPPAQGWRKDGVLAFDGQRAPLACPTLALEGGADSLVPLATHRGFLVGNRHPLSHVETWSDGEHTIYNHAAARNTLAANWFALALASPRTTAASAGISPS
jgi:hypothetical protein